MFDVARDVVLELARLSARKVLRAPCFVLQYPLVAIDRATGLLEAQLGGAKAGQVSAA